MKPEYVDNAGPGSELDLCVGETADFIQLLIKAAAVGGVRWWRGVGTVWPPPG